MKTIFGICALIVVVAAGFLWRAAARPKQFGAFSRAPRAAVEAIIANPKAYSGRVVEIEGVISEQCKAMGCYFFFRSGKETLRVDIQDIAMTAPMREGRKARVEGQTVPYNDGYEFVASAVEFE